MRHIALCFLLTAAFTQYAEAQVFKCAGANGKIVYSDRACDQNASGGMIMREPTLEEKIREREEAYAAEIRKQDRRAIEQERELIEQQRREIAERREMMERRYQPQHKGYEERLRERNASVRSVLTDPKENRNRSKSSGGKTTTATQCSHNQCTDNEGTLYTTGGGTSMYNTKTGAVCTLAGTAIFCP